MGERIERKPRATIVDIARLAGVSKSTVSLVLKSSDLVHADTRAKVHAAMGSLGYVYNRGAANLRMARSNMVGMVISDLVNPFFAELAVGIEEAIYGTGFVPILANTCEDPERQRQVLRSMSEQGVAGILISPTDAGDPRMLADLKQTGIPVVTMMRRLEDSDLPYVGQDNVGGERAATDYLIALGHRRIAFLGGYATMTTRIDRVAGYRSALEAHGIAFDPALVTEAFPDRAGGAEAVRHALAQTPQPTAAVCYNDIVAIGAIGELARRGFLAGRDFSILGFDDIAEAAHAAPPLTTMAADTKKLGAQAARVLLALIAGESPPQKSIVGATRIIPRESCAAPLGETLRRRA